MSFRMGLITFAQILLCFLPVMNHLQSNYQFAFGLKLVKIEKKSIII